MNIIISGGKGFLGSAMIPPLVAAGHQVAIWSRTPDEEKRLGVKAFHWDPVAGPPAPESLQGIDAVIHLAGERVAHKWTDEVKVRIRESRVVGTRNLVTALSAMSPKPRVLVCSSATGFYGERGEEELSEASAPGTSFLAEVCQEWEREADAAAASGIRLVKIRTGMVLGAAGGALARLVPAFNSKMGGKLGSGKQWTSWIHIRDIVELYRFALEREVAGVLNGTAPNPVRNDAFTEALGAALDQPAKLSIPEFALKMMFGEMAEVMLASQKVIPEATERAGFQFRFPEVAAALRDAVRKD